MNLSIKHIDRYIVTPHRISTPPPYLVLDIHMGLCIVTPFFVLNHSKFAKQNYLPFFFKDELSNWNSNSSNEKECLFFANFEWFRVSVFWQNRVGVPSNNWQCQKFDAFCQIIDRINVKLLTPRRILFPCLSHKLV